MLRIPDLATQPSRKLVRGLQCGRTRILNREGEGTSTLDREAIRLDGAKLAENAKPEGLRRRGAGQEISASGRRLVTPAELSASSLGKHPFRPEELNDRPIDPAASRRENPEPNESRSEQSGGIGIGLGLDIGAARVEQVKMVGTRILQPGLEVPKGNEAHADRSVRHAVDRQRWTGGR